MGSQIDEELYERVIELAISREEVRLGRELSDAERTVLALIVAPELFADCPLAPAPTEYFPGTVEKIHVMEERVAAGYAPFHPGDACLVKRDKRAFLPTVEPNGHIVHITTVSIDIQDPPPRPRPVDPPSITMPLPLSLPPASSPS